MRKGEVGLQKSWQKVTRGQGGLIKKLISLTQIFSMLNSTAFQFFLLPFQMDGDGITVSCNKIKEASRMWFGEERSSEIQKQSLRDVLCKWLLLNFDSLGEDISNFCKILRKKLWRSSFFVNFFKKSWENIYVHF